METQLPDAVNKDISLMKYLLRAKTGPEMRFDYDIALDSYKFSYENHNKQQYHYQLINGIIKFSATHPEEITTKDIQIKLLQSQIEHFIQLIITESIPYDETITSWIAEKNFESTRSLFIRGVIVVKDNYSLFHTKFNERNLFITIIDGRIHAYIQEGAMQFPEKYCIASPSFAVSTLIIHIRSFGLRLLSKIEHLGETEGTKIRNNIFEIHPFE